MPQGNSARQTINVENQIDLTEAPPSLEQADEILARYRFKEAGTSALAVV